MYGTDFVHGLMAEYRTGLPAPDHACRMAGEPRRHRRAGAAQPVMIVGLPADARPRASMVMACTHSVGGVTLPTTSFDPELVWRAVQERVRPT